MSAPAEVVKVCKANKFGPGARHLIKTGRGRNIAVYNVGGKGYAIDNACYHHGGPLHNGDIEEMGGHPCVVCPWHSYRIALDTGEGLYMGIDIPKAPAPAAPGSGDPPPAMVNPTACVKSKGKKQRTHTVSEQDGYIVVTVELDGPKLESDAYGEMKLANKEQAGKAPGGGAGGLHSSAGGGTLGQSGSAGPVRSGQFLGGNQIAPGVAPGGGNAPRRASSGRIKVSCLDVKNAARSGAVKQFTFALEGATFASMRVVPGMYGTFHVESATALKAPLRRTWTITTIPTPDTFTIAVKKKDGGAGSTFLHDSVNPLQEPDALTAIEFGGTFTLAANRELLRGPCGNRVVLLSAGVGITPMAAALLQMEYRVGTVAAVLLHSDRRPEDIAFHEDLKHTPRLAIEYFLTGPAAGGPQGLPDPTPPSKAKASVQYNAGRMTAAHIRVAVERRFGGGHDAGDGEGTGAAPPSAGGPLPPAMYMLCGPEAFMENAKSLLLNELGVNPEHLLTEAFDF